MSTEIISAIITFSQSSFFINHFVNKTYFTSYHQHVVYTVSYVRTYRECTCSPPQHQVNASIKWKHHYSLLQTVEYNLLLRLHGLLKLLVPLFLLYWWIGVRATASKLSLNSRRSETIEKLVIAGRDTSRAPSSEREIRNMKATSGRCKISVYSNMCTQVPSHS